jgi:hypothetical protein
MSSTILLTNGNIAVAELAVNEVIGLAVGPLPLSLIARTMNAPSSFVSYKKLQIWTHLNISTTQLAGKRFRTNLLLQFPSRPVPAS